MLIQSWFDARNLQGVDFLHIVFDERVQHYQALCRCVPVSRGSWGRRPQVRFTFIFMSKYLFLKLLCNLTRLCEGNALHPTLTLILRNRISLASLLYNTRVDLRLMVTPRF